LYLAHLNWPDTHGSTGRLQDTSVGGLINVNLSGRTLEARQGSLYRRHEFPCKFTLNLA